MTDPLLVEYILRCCGLLPADHRTVLVAMLLAADPSAVAAAWHALGCGEPVALPPPFSGSLTPRGAFDLIAKMEGSDAAIAIFDLTMQASRRVRLGVIDALVRRAAATPAFLRYLFRVLADPSELPPIGRQEEG